ncbi:MAG: hypothetical protein IPO48_13750 [Saprospiraceae bacterium]|nr:hypothetical protein [Saprospiraceae bacterium]
MKSLSFLSILLMASMFLFLGGCQKDEAFNVRRKIDSSVFENLEPVQEYVSLSKVLTLERFLRKNRQYFNNRSGIELDTSMISVVKFGDDHKTYSLNILGRKEGAIQNLIFVETNGVISKPNIIEFQGTRKFVEDFNNRMVGFEKFEGTITQFTLQSFLNASRDDLIDCDCYKDYIKPVLVSPSYGDTNAGESSEQIVIQLNNLGFINLGHGATAIQTAGNHAVLTNLNNSINCPPGTIPVYYLGIKFCLSGGGSDMQAEDGLIMGNKKLLIIM